VDVEGERAFAASRAIVWEVLNDPEAMAKTMPGVESFDVHDANRWTARVNVPLALGGLKLKVDMEKTEERELEFAAMQLRGKGVGALVNMQTRFDLSDAAAGGTVMRWKAEIRVAGQSVSMGQRVLQPIVNQQVEHVLGALDEQVQTLTRQQADKG
jgi:carbon monoxide dehydrogenase subunit G